MVKVQMVSIFRTLDIMDVTKQVRSFIMLGTECHASCLNSLYRKEDCSNHTAAAAHEQPAKTKMNKQKLLLTKQKREDTSSEMTPFF